MEIHLSPIVIQGLQNLDTIIPLDLSKKLITHSIKATLHPETTLPPVPEIFATNGDKAKQSAYAIVTAYALATKHCCDVDGFMKLLKPHTTSEVAKEMCRLYEEHRKDLFLRQLQIGQSFPHITDVQWRIVCDVKSSTFDSSSGEVCFQINLGRFDHVSGERETNAEFLCNTEELSLLLNKLKEIERHCEKLAVE